MPNQYKNLTNFISFFQIKFLSYPKQNVLNCWNEKDNESKKIFCHCCDYWYQIYFFFSYGHLRLKKQILKRSKKIQISFSSGWISFAFKIKLLTPCSIPVIIEIIRSQVLMLWFVSYYHYWNNLIKVVFQVIYTL